MSALRDLFASEYLGVLGVGTTASGISQELQTIFDTGSGELWVASDLCKRSPCDIPGRRQFDHFRSTSFKFSEKRLKLITTFGSGQLTGPMGVDDVRVGPLTVKGQVIGLIEEEIGQAFVALPLEGIAGLGLPGITLEPGMSFVENLVKANAAAKHRLARLQFAFYLHKDLARGGSILWGGHDARLYEGPLQWFPVLPENMYWAMDLVSLHVGNVSFDFAQSTRRSRGASAAPRLIVDSGTTFFTATGAVLAAVMSQARPAPCNQIAGFPRLVYTVRDVHGSQRELVIDPEDYMVDDTANEGECMPGFVDLGVIKDRPAMILGELFMRRYFTVFSLDGPGHREAAPAVLRPFIGLARTRFDHAADAFFQEVGRRS